MYRFDSRLFCVCGERGKIRRLTFRDRSFEMVRVLVES